MQLNLNHRLEGKIILRIEEESIKRQKKQETTRLHTLKKLINAGSSRPLVEVADGADEDDSRGLSVISDTGSSSSNSLQYMQNISSNHTILITYKDN